MRGLEELLKVFLFLIQFCVVLEVAHEIGRLLIWVNFIYTNFILCITSETVEVILVSLYLLFSLFFLFLYCNLFLFLELRRLDLCLSHVHWFVVIHRFFIYSMFLRNHITVESLWVSETHSLLVQRSFRYRLLLSWEIILFHGLLLYRGDTLRVFKRIPNPKPQLLMEN